MLKKVSIIMGCILICSCSQWRRTPSYQPYYNYATGSAPLNMVESTDYSRIDLGNTESFRVAVLLPLSGKVADMGQSMKNAAMMAIGDINSNNLVVQFYDTKGTGSGARVAFENAVNGGSELILGPLMSEEVIAISEPARSRNIPIISFSTSAGVLHEGVYSLGLLPEEQIDRIVRYAAEHGRSKLAVVLPDNQSGMNMLKSTMKAAEQNNIQLVKVGFYAPNSMDFTDLVTQMKGGFDTLLIPESGNRLKAIASMFSYYDVSAPEVLFMGTSVWANSNLSKETELYDAVYPTMSFSNRQKFAQKYYDLFNERPSGLSIFAYDAVALAASLANKDKDYIEDAITRGDGYYGMSGAFRLFANGSNEHGLDVVKITPQGERIVDAGSNRFYGISQRGFSVYGNTNTPQIYGKESTQVQRDLFEE